jgi:hypothetical protein
LFIAALFFQNRINFSMHAVVNVTFFSISTVFLLMRETSDFYKLHSPRWGKPKDKSGEQKE